MWLSQLWCRHHPQGLSVETGRKPPNRIPGDRAGWKEDILLSSLRAQSLITVWDQCHQLIYLLCWNVACPLARETGDAISPGELHIWELSNGFFLLSFSQQILPVIFFLLPAKGGVITGGMLRSHGRDVPLVSCSKSRRQEWTSESRICRATTAGSTPPVHSPRLLPSPAGLPASFDWFLIQY